MTMILPDAVNQARDLVEPALRAAVDRLHPRLGLVASHHFGWRDEHGRPTEGGGGGKAVRATMVVQAARAVGGSFDDGLPGAVAIELVHNFSILHDDLMDRDERRRHRATAWALFGEADAILAGDALYNLAVAVLLESGERGVAAVRLLTSATNALIGGQAEDLGFEGRTDVTVEESLAMCAGKTGALMACASASGALLGGGAAAAVASLSDYGHHLGLAFQAVDDLLGVWGEPEETGKPAGNDLRQRKKSLPVAAALSSADGPRLEELLRRPNWDESALVEARELLERSGAKQMTSELADRELAAALAALENVDLEPEATLQLAALARFVTARSF